MKHYVKSTHASTRDEFLHVGLADSALLGIHNQDVIVVSADLGFYLRSARRWIPSNQLQSRQGCVAALDFDGASSKNLT
jgi:hypothetical protein